MTRAVTYAPPSEVPDLDQPGQVCAPLRTQLAAGDGAGPPERRFSYDDGLLARPAKRGAGIELLSCRGRPRILHAPGEPENMVLRAGLLTWATGAPASAYNQILSEHRGYGYIWTYQLCNGHRTCTASFKRGTRHTWCVHPVRDGALGPPAEQPLPKAFFAVRVSEPVRGEAEPVQQASHAAVWSRVWSFGGGASVTSLSSRA